MKAVGEVAMQQFNIESVESVPRRKRGCRSNGKSSIYNFELLNPKDENYTKDYMKKLALIDVKCEACNEMYNLTTIKRHNKTKKHLRNANVCITTGMKPDELRMEYKKITSENETLKMELDCLKQKFQLLANKLSDIANSA